MTAARLQQTVRSPSPRIRVYAVRLRLWVTIRPKTPGEPCPEPTTPDRALRAPRRDEPQGSPINASKISGAARVVTTPSCGAFPCRVLHFSAVVDSTPQPAATSPPGPAANPFFRLCWRCRNDHPRRQAASGLRRQERTQGCLQAAHHPRGASPRTDLAPYPDQSGSEKPWKGPVEWRLFRVLDTILLEEIAFQNLVSTLFPGNAVYVRQWYVPSDLQRLTGS